MIPSHRNQFERNKISHACLKMNDATGALHATWRLGLRVRPHDAVMI